MAELDWKNKIKAYWQNIKYIFVHKYYVAIECFKMGLFIHAFTHDLSKFLPSEFFPYAEKFFVGNKEKKYSGVRDRFAVAWLMHQHRNKHHWDYWVNSNGKAVPMPHRYLKQLVVDWRAVGKTTGASPINYYKANKERIIMHEDTLSNLFMYINN